MNSLHYPIVACGAQPRLRAHTKRCVCSGKHSNWHWSRANPGSRQRNIALLADWLAGVKLSLSFSVSVFRLCWCSDKLHSIEVGPRSEIFGKLWYRHASSVMIGPQTFLSQFILTRERVAWDRLQALLTFWLRLQPRKYRCIHCIYIYM